MMNDLLERLVFINFRAPKRYLEKKKERRTARSNR